MSWYNTSAKNQIDARLPLLGAEMLQKGFTNLGDSMQNALGESQALKIAKVNANAKLKVSQNNKEIAGIRFNTEKYKSDKAYRRAVDSAIIKAKATKEAAKARVKAADISAKAKKYYADVTERNNIRTTSAKKVVKSKKTPKLNLKGLSDTEILKKLHQEDVGKVEI